MIIRDLVCTAVRSGYFNKDLLAIKRGPEADGFAYRGAPVSPGFEQIIQPGEAISVMLVLEDGQVATGDCVDVILAGLAGRDPVFRAADHLPLLRTMLRDTLRGRAIDRFRPLAEEIEEFRQDGAKLHTALRYGLSQALLRAAALAHRVTMAEIIAAEYGCAVAETPVPLLASCITHDYDQIDRMILKRLELLPHASFHIPERDLGPEGGKLLEYGRRLAQRVRALGGAEYRPRIHLDVYGTIGELFERDIGRIVDYLGRLAQAVTPLDLLIETPILAESQAAQIATFQELRQALRRAGHAVAIIADEWCNTLDDIRAFAAAEATDYAQVKTPDLGGIGNTIEALLYCRQVGLGSYIGGSGNETDHSAQVCAHVALACQADFLLSKPGFGGDEGVMIESNEMLRALALIATRAERR
ncbi:MAG: methylaspartate ammonia-lyase [Acidisphaera sp.]|nr:methylaspartate ammonia-lyase [Acidisphaera sp.]